MVIVLFAGLITAADDSDEECDAALDVINSDLIMYKCLAVNRIIEEYCIGTKLTYEQKEYALNSFHAEIQPLSVKLIEKVNGVEYHYPKFLIDDGTDGYEATENTRYMISALDEISIKDYVSVYKGISVSAYELPEDSIDDAANIINKKIVALEGYGLTKEELNKRLSEFKKISAEYSGKVIYKTNGQDVKQEYSNSVLLIAGENRFEDSVGNYKIVVSQGGGEASIYEIKLMKYEAGNMTKRLSGAIFELLDASLNNILDKNGKNS